MKILMIVLGLFFVLHLSSTIINIPEDFDSIQQGLDFVSEGDTILVAEGIYFENIIWPETTGIQLIGSNEENCIIDGYQNGRVITFENQVDSATLVSNFAITNGSAFYGGGIYCNGNPCLENLTISGNNAGCGEEFVVQNQLNQLFQKLRSAIIQLTKMVAVCIVLKEETRLYWM